MDGGSKLERRVTGPTALPHERGSTKSVMSRHIHDLIITAERLGAEQREFYEMYGKDVNTGEFADEKDIHRTIQEINEKLGTREDMLSILSRYSFDDFKASALWRGGHIPEPERQKDMMLLHFPAHERMELWRRKVIHEIRTQWATFSRIKTSIIEVLGLVPLEGAIADLEDVPASISERKFAEAHPDAKSLDLPVSSSPEYTRLHRALMAIKHELEAQIGNHPNIEMIREQTRKFALGILNPAENTRFINITDVYGSESDVPNSQNDGTRLRVHEHRREIEERYGVKLEVFDQGTSIKCPEQCGFYALVAVNQARRMNPGRKIARRVFALNNAARTEDADHLKSGEKSKSTGLVYFTFDLGDGVEHSGVAYGHQTLTYLKPYITQLYEIEGTDAGTQFRSLEFQQHIATMIAMTNGAFPAAYKGKKLDIDEIVPEPNLGKNEIQFMGMDKYGNGVTSIPARQIFERFLSPDQKMAQVRVTLLDRRKQLIESADTRVYTLARSLGEVRDGSPALWESSTPTTENPKDGFLSIGMFMQKPGDTNADVITIPAGSYIRIERM